ncbi:MAG: uroporphyrinogen decarboxylase family protein [Candidatus Humimicrobiaceae bacterium]
MNLNSRERVKKTIAHKEPDRVPIDNNGFVSGMHEVAYKNLLRYLNIEDEIIIYDPVQRLAVVKDEVKNILGVDTIYIYPNSPSGYKYIENSDKTFKDEFGVIYKKVGYYADCFIPPLRGKSFEEIKSFKFPDPEDMSRFAGLSLKAEEIHKNTELSVWAGVVSSLFYFAWIIRGLEDFMMDIYANPKIALYLMDKLTDWNMKFFKGFYSEIGNYIDVFWIGDDWGTQDGPLISQVYFRKEIVPRFRKMISFIKTMTQAKCCYHSCGTTYWCMEDLIDMGVDIIHPIQANAKYNDTAKLKKEFGDKVCFHGGTNNQGVFHKDIHALTIDTLKRIKDLAPNGGYIFSSGHNIQANMSPENILKLFEIAREFGKYPIDISNIDQKIDEEKEYLKK